MSYCRWGPTMLKTKDSMTVTIRLGDWQKIATAKIVDLSLRIILSTAMHTVAPEEALLSLTYSNDKLTSLQMSRWQMMPL